VNGEQFEMNDVTGKQLIQRLVSNDWTALPASLVLEARSSDGRTIRLVVPYDDTSAARVFIEDKE
jgi:hypothetical protein